jgi:hypothetical protein
MLARQLVRDRTCRRVPNTLDLAYRTLRPVFCICKQSVAISHSVVAAT